jgi:hypothetical protein
MAINQEISLQFTEVSGNSVDGFSWVELYEVQTEGKPPVFLKVSRSAQNNKLVDVCVQVLVDDVELLRLDGDGLNGSILEQAKKFLRDRVLISE